MTGSPKRPRLGRGLDAMLPAQPSPRRQNLTVAVGDLHASKSQPRHHFDNDALDELSTSIKQLGVLEPIVVRTRSEGGFEIIAGERRWRAAQRAGVLEVPVFVRELGDQESFEAALVENIQREDLNPVETARAFQRMKEEFGHSHEQIAERVGKNRSTVANSLRLLKLPDEILDHVQTGQLTEGHARALLGAPDPATTKRIAGTSIHKGLSVRQTEALVRASAKTQVTPPPGTTKSPNVRHLETRLSKTLGTRAKVTDSKGTGTIQLRFESYDQLDHLLEILLTGEK